MDIEYKGANCVVISNKKEVLVIDPKLSLVGLKDYSGKMNVLLATQADFVVNAGEALIVDGPGEYETETFSIKGAPAKRSIDTPDQPKISTIYRLSSGDVNIAVIGHIGSELTEEQLEILSVIDIVILPVGGNGYTLDAHTAVQIVRQLDPKIIIPVHYSDLEVKYEMPQADLEPFIKELGASARETTAKLKIKNGVMPEVMTVFEITRTS